MKPENVIDFNVHFQWTLPGAFNFNGEPGSGVIDGGKGQKPASPEVVRAVGNSAWLPLPAVQQQGQRR